MIPSLRYLDSTVMPMRPMWRRAAHELLLLRFSLSYDQARCLDGSLNDSVSVLCPPELLWSIKHGACIGPLYRPIYVLRKVACDLEKSRCRCCGDHYAYNVSLFIHEGSTRTTTLSGNSRLEKTGVAPRS